MDDPFIRALSCAIWICNGFVARRLDTRGFVMEFVIEKERRDIYREKNDEKILNDSVYEIYYRNIMC